MKAELFNLVLLGQYLVDPLVAIRYLGFMGHMFYYLFIYFKGEKIPGLFFFFQDSCPGTSVFCGARCQ